VNFPDCGNSLQFYLDLTAWSSPINLKFTKNISLTVPRVCVSDFGVNVPFTQACFRLDEFAVYKQVVFGKLNMDVSVGISALQYTVANITIYDFILGNRSSNPCYNLGRSADCLAVSTCGWCSLTNQCLEKRPDGLSDLCRFCPRCSFVTTNSPMDECVSKDSCGWCKSLNACLPGDRIGPLDPTVMCGGVSSSSTAASTADVMQSTGGSEWTYDTKGTNGVSTGGAVALSFVFMILGGLLGVFFGVIVMTIIWVKVYRK
jgi:hypothetical protein